MREYTYDGLTFRLDLPAIEDTSYVIKFTKDCGTEVTLCPILGLFDPDLHQSQGFTTIRSVLKWWVKNRSLIMEACGGRGTSAWENFFLIVCKYFDYVPSGSLLNDTYDECKGHLEGQLLDKSLRLNVMSNSRSSGSSTFLLATGQQPETPQVPLYSHTLTYKGWITLYPLNTSEVPSNIHNRWTNKHNYTFKMNESDFNWYRSVSKENAVHFGMELEISTNLSTLEIQHIIAEVEPKQEPFFIFKQDGSVSGRYSNLVELVTVPCTPRYLRKNWKIFFEKLDRLAKAKGKTIGDYFDTATGLNNGLHIHVSKDSFLDRSHTNKFLTAWHQWDDDAVGVIADAACRPNGYKDHGYCRIYKPYQDTAPSAGVGHGIPKFKRAAAQRSLAKRLKGIRVGERSTVAHDGNSATVEVRVYQGIFDIGHILRSISFTEAMFEYCQNIGYSGFDEGFAPQFTKYIKQYSKFAAIHNIFKYNKEAA
jgi:hypothetical protein